MPPGGQPDEGGVRVSYESAANPIKVGYLMDFVLPAEYPEDRRLDLTQSLDLIFKRGHAQGVIDRPIEVVYREVEGLPKGSAKAVIDAYGEFVDEGCLAVFGPFITDNCEPTRVEIERRFEVPAISVTGSEAWLGPWTFSLPMGSLTDEPVFWAEQMVNAGYETVGALVERSHLAHTYITNFRAACERAGIRIVAEQMIAQTAQDITAEVTKLHETRPDAIVHCGFGFGMAMTNMILQSLDWDPPRFMSTAFENAWLNDLLWQAMLGWTGVDQYDEANPVGQGLLDEFDEAYGRRPEYCVPVVNFDIANALLSAFADAHPLTPDGVRAALERVKMIPAASGSPGTYVSFGNWMHRGWVGSGYLVARQLDPNGINSHLVARFGGHWRHPA
jgi:ABC-type branched-subunit amino acid transport system substrate-binding protein